MGLFDKLKEKVKDAIEETKTSIRETVDNLRTDRLKEGLARTREGITERIGIAAPAGSLVKAVEAGTVELAGPLEGYGQSVVVGHGAGYYTLYLRLRSINVTAGQTVRPGQIVGTVGGENTPEGAHLEFQVRTPGPGGSPRPVDPLNWLRARAGAR